MASARRRLGVAVVLDPPVADAVDGMRRAVGDPSLGRVGPHVTLVPPVNVRADQLGAALGAFRAAAAAQPGPLTLTLGPPATFLPDKPVLYLEVGGDLEPLRALRDRVFVAPLARPLSWPWVPHVTLADTADEARIAAAIAALDRFTAVVSIEHLVLLHETPGRIWAPLADVALGPGVVVGRGGLALEITRGRMLDPEVLQMIGEAGPAPGTPGEQDPAPARAPSFPIVLSARRERQAVGVAVAWRTDGGGQVAVMVAPGVRRQGIGGILLAQLESAVREAGWGCPVLHAHGPMDFYEARSGWALPSRTGPTRTAPAS